MSEAIAFYTKEVQKMRELLEAIPLSDRGVLFERRRNRQSLTVHGETAEALMYVLDNTHNIASCLRYMQQVHESSQRLQTVIAISEDDKEEIIQKMRAEKMAIPMMIVCREPESRRIADLLEANNRYLQEARDARAELKAYKEKNGHGS